MSQTFSFIPLLKLREEDTFIWEPKHQAIFDKIKEYLANPLFLMLPKTNYPLLLYILDVNGSIESLLA